MLQYQATRRLHSPPHFFSHPFTLAAGKALSTHVHVHTRCYYLLPGLPAAAPGAASKSSRAKAYTAAQLRSTAAAPLSAPQL